MKESEIKDEKFKSKIIEFLRDKTEPQNLQAICGHLQEPIHETIRRIEPMVADGVLEQITTVGKLPSYRLPPKQSTN
jgi:hypothetical protein